MTDSKIKTNNITSENSSHTRASQLVSPTRRKSMTALLAATLAGGSLFSATCETRVRDAIVGGTKTYVFGLLTPQNVADLFIEATGEPDGA